MKVGIILLGALAMMSLAACADSQRWQAEEYQPYAGDPWGPRADWAHGEAVAKQDWKDALKDMEVPTKEDGVSYDAAADEGETNLWFTGKAPWY